MDKTIFTSASTFHFFLQTSTSSNFSNAVFILYTKMIIGQIGAVNKIINKSPKVKDFLASPIIKMEIKKEIVQIGMRIIIYNTPSSKSHDTFGCLSYKRISSNLYILLYKFS